MKGRLQSPSDRRLIQPLLSGMNSPNAVNQDFRRGVFHYEAPNTEVHGLHDLAIVDRRRQQYRPALPSRFSQPAEHCQAVAAGHTQVEHEHIRRFAFERVQRDVRVCAGRDHAEVCLAFEQLVQRLKHDRVIVDEHQSDCHGFLIVEVRMAFNEGRDMPSMRVQSMRAAIDNGTRSCTSSCMAEILAEFQAPVASEDGRLFAARACGGKAPDGLWQGWVEFTPLDGGAAIRSPRETTQPNRVDAEYWAGGLTPVYLEGALRRALSGPPPVRMPRDERPIFDTPLPGARHAARGSRESALDPFSVYEKGEQLLRKQLGALSEWHLVNIVVAYDLSEEPVDSLNQQSAGYLIDTIVRGVRERQRAWER